MASSGPAHEQWPTEDAAIAPSAWTAAPELVRQPVDQLYAALDALRRSGRELPFRERYQRVGPVVTRVFDLDFVLRASVGRGWSVLSEAARDKLADAFRTFTITTYVANFDRDTGQRFEILPELRVAGGEPIVQTRIITPAGALLRLDYVMRHTDAGWRIVDVLLDGSISRIAVQRSDFRALLRQDDADALIVSLRRKVVALSGNSFDP